MQIDPGAKNAEWRGCAGVAGALWGERENAASFCGGWGSFKQGMWGTKVSARFL